MLQQIRQVSITYISHRYLLMAVLPVVVFIIGPNLLAASQGNQAVAGKAQPISMILGMPLFFAMPFLVGQVKTQFAHPRARLIPNFLPAHLLVLGAVLLILIGLYPLIIASCTGFSPLGLVALAMAIATPFAVGTHFNRWSWTVLSVAVFYSLLTNWGMNWWILQAPGHVLAHSLTVIIGGVSLAVWFWRLSELREEMDEYQRTIQWQSLRRSSGEAVEQRRIIAQHVQRNALVFWINDFWLADFGTYRAGPARLVRLLRFGLNAQPAELQALFFGSMLLLISIFLTDFSFVKHTGAGGLTFLLQMSLLMPGVWAGQSLVMRQPRMAVELMRPVYRNQYFDCLLTSVAWNTAIAWLILNAAAAIALSRVMHDQVSLSSAAMFVFLSVAITMATFGLATRTAIWKSNFQRFFALMVGPVIFATPMLAWWNMHDRVGDWPFVAIAIVVGGLGLALIQSARRAWTSCEFT